MSSFSMIFAHAETTAHTDDPYANAADGEKLLDVNFNADYFKPVTDVSTFTAGGKYDSGKTSQPWYNAIASTATIVEEDGAALKVDKADITGQGNVYAG